MKRLMRLVPSLSVELLARVAAFLVGLAQPAYSFVVERKIRGFYWSLLLGGRNLMIGRGVQLESDRIVLGDNVKLYDGGQYVTGPTGYIKIGSNSHISRLSILSGGSGIEIGEGCAISGHVAIYSVTTDTNARTIVGAESQRKPVLIGSNVYIGAGAIVIPGVHIADNAVVAAGAVVTKDVPAGTLAKGVPATHAPLSKRQNA